MSMNGAQAARLPVRRLACTRAILATMFVLVCAATSHANDLKISSTRVHLDETVELTVSLTGDFASLDDIDLVLENLKVETGPRTSVEFSFINGVTSRRRSFIYTLKPVEVGAATIGPMAVVSEKGTRDILGPARIEVLADATAALSADPAALLRHYASTSRPRVAVGVESDQKTAVVGEQVVVTWYIYTAESTESVQVTSAPPLSDFWVEEITVDRTDDFELMIDGMPVRKVPIRRAAIYPLRSGRLTIPPLEINAEVMEVMGSMLDRFGMINTRTAPVRRKSPPLSIDVNASPSGQVGSYTMLCGTPRSSAAGPVAFDVTVTGDGNLRAAQAPKFIATPDADVQIASGEMKIDRKNGMVSMQRTWRYLLFPKRTGPLAIPSLNFGYYDPKAQQGRSVSCTFSPVDVTTLEARASEGDAPKRKGESSRLARFVWPMLGVSALIAIMAWAVSRKRRGQRVLDERAVMILSADTPFELRRRFDDLLASAKLSRAALMAEASERGELARAVSSLIEYRIQQPSHAAEVDEELHERLVELIAALK